VTADPADLADRPAERIALSTPRGTFHALAWGDPAAPPLVWLHGFPDHPPTAAPFLARLASARRVIAPWLRGYAPSPLAGPYDVDTLAADATAIIEHVTSPGGAGPGGAVDLVGHDWGAVITYRVCSGAPERVRRAVAMAVPHPLAFLRALRDVPAQRLRSWYMLLFQLPGAGWLAGARDLALIDRLWRAWSPSFVLDEPRRAELHACLAASLPAPLGYYRAMVRPLTGLRRRLAGGWRPIATPLLQLHGAEDGCILPSSMAPGSGADRQFLARTFEIVSSAGHFLHLEQPAAIAERVRAWLA
jgi:pimeloyl-ACP methyl ester carboxylesterase